MIYPNSEDAINWATHLHIIIRSDDSLLIETDEYYNENSISS